jgi:hypothetical protein
MTENSASRFKNSPTLAPQEKSYLEQLDAYFAESPGSNTEKLENFAKYVPRQKLARFLFKYDLMQRILLVQGSIVECGVLHGGGLMAWAKLSSILEPVNHQRRIIGFDTFEGYKKIAKEDQTSTYQHMHVGGLAVDSYADLERAIALYDQNRFLSHIPKVQLVRGDVVETVPRYLEERPHTVVSLLYIDMNVFEPTKVALEHFVPRMPKGAIIVFDALNSEYSPGETVAVLQTIGVRNLRIERSTIDSMPSFAVLD